MRGFKTTLELKIFKRASTSLLCALEMTEVEPIIVKRVKKKKIRIGKNELCSQLHVDWSQIYLLFAYSFCIQ